MFSKSVYSMPARRRVVLFVSLLLAFGLVLGGSSSRMRADSGTCGSQTLTLPFTDVMGSIFFCSIAEIYFQEITFGTSATTYSPSSNVTRDQMAAFLGRTLDTGLRRGSERAALDQFWTTTPHYDLDLGITSLGGTLELVRSDGLHLWVADSTGNVYVVRASDGKLQDTWTGATNAQAVVCAMGRVFVIGYTAAGNGRLFMIDPTTAAGAVTAVATAVGQFPSSIAFDGNKFWTANVGSVSIVTPGSVIPWSVTTVAGFGTLAGIVYDGANIWVADGNSQSLKKLDASGVVLQDVPVGTGPQFPVFDGKNIWVPSVVSNTVTVVRASNGEILATLSSNGLNVPVAAAFDGERVLVTNMDGDSVSLWKATDLTPLGSFSAGAGTDPLGACSDGQYFWVTLSGTGKLARF